jgi:hypothetical protein
MRHVRRLDQDLGERVRRLGFEAISARSVSDHGNEVFRIGCGNEQFIDAGHVHLHFKQAMKEAVRRPRATATWQRL